MSLDQNKIEKLKPGMQIKVWERISEGEKSRLAQFTGTVLAIKHGRGKQATITVRNASLAGVGVEKVYPLHSPIIEKLEIMRVPGRVRRSKLYYLRNVSRKKARRKLATKEVKKSN